MGGGVGVGEYVWRLVLIGSLVWREMDVVLGLGGIGGVGLVLLGKMCEGEMVNCWGIGGSLFFVGVDLDLNILIRLLVFFGVVCSVLEFVIFLVGFDIRGYLFVIVDVDWGCVWLWYFLGIMGLSWLVDEFEFCFVFLLMVDKWESFLVNSFVFGRVEFRLSIGWWKGIGW